MKQFFAFVEKEFYHIFRDKATMLIILLMPVVQVLIFGFAITTDIQNTEIAVLDQCNTPESRTLVAKMDAGSYFQVSGYLDSPEQIDEVFKKGKIKMAVVIPPGFSRDLTEGETAQVQLVTDATNPNNATMEVMYLGNIISEYFRSDIAGASLITITIGGNDLMDALYGYLVESYNTNNPTKPITLESLKAALMDLSNPMNQLMLVDFSEQVTDAGAYACWVAEDKSDFTAAGKTDTHCSERE